MSTGGLSWISAVAALVAPAAIAGITGNVELQSQTVRTDGETAFGSLSPTTTTLLQETVSLHYAGLPFGPAVALVTMGGGFTNIDSALGTASPQRGRAGSFDLSAAFLPRRSYPLRIFARGTVVDAGGGGLVAAGTNGNSLGYGGSLNLAQGHYLPSLRLDAEELRFSHLFGPSLGDLRRTLNASAFKQVGADQLNLTLHLDHESVANAGSFENRYAMLSWTNPFRQTLLTGRSVDHSLTNVAGLTSEKEAAVSHAQRWSPRVSSSSSVQYSSASASDGAEGNSLSAQAGASVQAIPDQLSLSANANAATTHTHSAIADASGKTYGAGGRAGYTRMFGAWRTGVSGGASVNQCDCALGNAGSLTSIDGGLSAGITTAERRSFQADYALARIFAAAPRGGKRLEQHLRGGARIPLGANTDANASAGYDDGYRELIDVRAGIARTLRERALSASLGLSMAFDHGSVGGDVRHSRGTVIVPATRFVAGIPTVARSITSATLNASWSPIERLDLQGLLSGSYTDATGIAGQYSTQLGIRAAWRLGRISVRADYQAVRTVVTSLTSVQQTIRFSIARPFEL